MKLFTSMSTVLKIMMLTKKQRKTSHSQETKHSIDLSSQMPKMLESSERELK